MNQLKAVSVRVFVLSLFQRLQDATIYQGDRDESFQLVLVGRSDLPDTHPLKTDGLLTAGYTTRFVAKPDLNLADNDAQSISTTLTPIDEDNAPLVLLPSDTSAIDFGSTKTVIRFFYQFQVSDGSTNIFTVDTGSFNLQRDIALTA